MSNLSSAVYSVNKGSSHALHINWTKEISKRLGAKRKNKVGVKFYTTPTGATRVAVRAKADPKKGFRPIQVTAAGNLCDSIRFGVGKQLGMNSAEPSVYRFTKDTMYVEIPFSTKFAPDNGVTVS